MNFSLRYTLQVAERERSILWQQHKKKAPMASFPPKRGATGSARPKTTSKLPTPTASEDDEDTISSSTISLQLESTVTSSVRPENRQNNAVALPIKTPLSPKRTNLRKRHSSAEVCKFSRQIMTVQFKFQHFNRFFNTPTASILAQFFSSNHSNAVQF